MDRVRPSRTRSALVAGVIAVGALVFPVAAAAGSQFGASALQAATTGTRHGESSNVWGGSKATGGSATPSSSGFPSAATTGVPSGTSLSGYTGSLTITQAGAVIDSKKITGTLVIKAAGVVVKNSLIVGGVDSDATGASVLIQDSEIDGGTRDQAAVGYANLTLRRVEVRGARVSVACYENCTIEDSWLHAQYLLRGSDWHVNGFLSNGGTTMVLRHNTLACDVADNAQGGGCTGPAAAFGDFEPVKNLTVDNNLFVGGEGAYCLYGGTDLGKPYGNQASGVVVTNNVFEYGPTGRCAAWGAAASFDTSRPGNVWSNNVWEDGKPLAAPGL